MIVKDIYTDGCLYKDTYTIIKMMDEEMQSKINPQFIDFLKENQEENYIGCVNPKKPLKEQELREEIKLMLSLIYINYLCNESEKQKIQQEDKIKIEQYNKSLIENIFKKKDEATVENKDLTVVKEKNVIQKLINKIRKIFNI